ncbi:MAG: hypothetical protein ACKOBF_04885, partial [Limnohabitans sp.]
ARPMTTDPARIVAANACQFESWLRANHQGKPEFWAVPGCSPVEHLELSVGGARQSVDGQPRLSDSLAQAKLLLRPLRPNDWGMALTLGRAVEHGPAGRRSPSNYLNLPLSHSLRDDALLLHLNLGARRELQSHRTIGTWGLASELQLRPGLQLIAEGYGERGTRPFLPGGLRYWLVPDRVQLDATYGTQTGSGSGERWVSIGLRLLSPPFLP